MPTAVNIKRTKVFANTAARVAATPDFVGQFGIQLDLASLWRSTSLAAGAWSTNFKMDGLELDYASLTNQSPEPGTPDDGLRVYVANATMLAIKNTGGDTAYINTGGLSGNRVLALPDSSGTFALSSTGETFTSITIDGTAGAGFVQLANQVSTPSTPVSAARIYAAADTFGILFPTGFSTLIDSSLLTATRAYSFPDASGTLLLSPVDLTSQVTGTLPYANGGTNATTQSAARVNLGGGRWFSNLAAAAAATPDTIGQVSSAFEGVDGVIYSAYGTSAGQVFPWMTYDGSDDAITINKILSTNSKSFSSGRIASAATAAQGGEHQLSTTGAFVDGVLELWNGTGGYSAVAVFDPDAGAFAGGAAAFGYSPGSSGADYTDVPHIATNPAGGIGSGIPFGIWIEENISASGYLAHRRVWMDNSNVRIYGVTAASAVGPIGIDVASSGNVTLAPTSAGSVIIGGGATASTLRFLEPSGSGTNYSEFKAQAQSANITYTFPATIPTANDVLTASSVSAPNVTLSWTTPGASSVANNLAAGRLTLTSGTPVLTTTTTGAGTVYFTPYNGNAIALYNGSSWELKTFTELSITLSSLTANTAYDVWAYNNSGTVALDTTAWTNVTTRATALAFQDGVYVKNGDATRRYVGSIVLDGSKQCSVNFGASADGGTAGRCDIWNMNNRVDISFCVRDTTNSWAWASTAWQQANASAGNQVTVFLGLTSPVRGSYTTTSGGTTNIRYAGIGVDATNALASFATSFAMPPGGSAAASSGHTAMFDGLIDVGQHYLAAIEFGNGSVTFYGDNATTQLRSGLIVRSQY